MIFFRCLHKPVNHFVNCAIAPRRYNNRPAIRRRLFGQFLGMAGMLFTVMLARWLFEVPFRGSFGALLLAGALFMLVALAMGLLISIVSKNQFVAGQIALIVTFLPAFILSGFIFDIGSMPVPVQVITHLVPARYYVAILQTLFLAGDVWPVILPNLGAMALMLLAFSLIIRREAHKRLE